MKRSFRANPAEHPEWKEQIKASFNLDAVPRLDAPLPRFLDGVLRESLSGIGLAELYSHQCEALEELDRGRNVLVSTPTASGKSLVYQLFALNCFLKDRKSRFLFLYPYKALAQDQHQKFTELMAKLGFPEFRAEIYDGDTPPHRRKKIQQEPPPVIMTNPDMLHLAFLAFRENWRELFSNLKLVVVDEAHIYRGIFGAHVHHLFWRLKRIASEEGRLPQWIGTSATIGEGRRFFEKLIGEDCLQISESGAPRPKRRLFVLCPPGSPYTLACYLMETLLEENARTVTFTKARRITELVYNWLIQRNRKYRKLVSSYRAGFLPSERRQIERSFFEGSLLGVVSTSAMEAGIDVGGLDACILVGFPGSLVSLYQRMGRVGRGDTPADIFLITMPDALDQYYLTHPGELLTRKVEEPVLDTLNVNISESHLLCAAKELPLIDEEFTAENSYRPALDTLDRKGRLVLDAEGVRWHTLSRNPHREVNLRSLGESYAVIDERKKMIGTIDGVRVYRECHEGAVYLHQGQSYESVEISPKEKKVFVRQVTSDFYTEVRSEKETEILEIFEEKEFPSFKLCFGRVKVTEKITGYVKKKLFSNETIGEYPVEAPPSIFETEGLWIVFPSKIVEELGDKKLHPMGSLHAVEHALIAVFPLLALADRWDLGGISYLLYPDFGTPAIFLYDGYPGGIGLARKGFSEMTALLEKTRQLVSACECESGCPSCIQSPKCGNGNRPLDKEGAVHALSFLLDRESKAKLPRIVMPRLSTPQKKRDIPRKRIVFDVETKRLAEEVGGWGNIRKMGLAIAVVRDIDNDEWLSFTENEVDDLVKTLFSAELVIGFNTLRFDYEVLEGYSRKDFSKVRSLDLLDVLYRRNGFRTSLQHLASANFGEGKSADGPQSVKWFREGRLDLVEEYCKKDVALTEKLYLKGLSEGFVLLPRKTGEIVRINVLNWLDEKP